MFFEERNCQITLIRTDIDSGKKNFFFIVGLTMRKKARVFVVT